MRQKIIETFAGWTSFSSTRSGCPIKSRSEIYPLIKTPEYYKILKGDTSINKEEFNTWHKESSLSIINKNKNINVGWATKLINVYLKTLVYVGQFGRPNLIECIHPPIDSGLWKGIFEHYKDDKLLLKQTHFRSKIKDINNYYKDYETIISGMEMIASRENCLLIEVEQFWKGTE